MNELDSERTKSPSPPSLDDIPDEDLRPTVTAADFSQSIAALKPSVTETDLIRYRGLREKFANDRNTKIIN